jgi:signal transduction histidine kinase
MNQLIRKMTSLMQLESGEEELNISRFEITGLLRGILKKYSILLDQKRITVSLQTPGELYCWGDEYFIENVINNYVSNAANHVSPRGDITVTAEVTERDGSARVRVSVFNTGACIGEEERVRIWESFYKADKARTRAYGGTGLGLSVVAAIMRAHNMPCGVDNRAEGPVFWFELEQG